MSNKIKYEVNMTNFRIIPGSPIAYWVSHHAIENFCGLLLSSIVDARIGMVSGDNDRFLRLWYEIMFNKIEFFARPNADPCKRKWYPLQKGGDFRRWYGNLFYVINWENNGYELKYDNMSGSRIRSHNYNGEQQFKEGISWNSITSGTFHCRFSPFGFTYDAAGPLCEVKNRDFLYYILGMLSSKIAKYYFSFMNPTLNFPSGYLEALPFITRNEYKKNIDTIVENNISSSKMDWDSFETSWDFKKHPLI